MCSKAISEASGKLLLSKFLGPDTGSVPCQCVSVDDGTNWDDLVRKNGWLKTEKLVVKVDMLIKRRGQLNLVGVKLGLDGVKEWIQKHRNGERKVGAVVGILDKFIVEPFVPHQQSEEMYVCITSNRDMDTVMFLSRGGVDVGDVDKDALTVDVATGSVMTEEQAMGLLGNLPKNQAAIVAKFLSSLHKLFVDLHFTYLEINPIVVTKAGQIYILDLAAKLDQTADFVCAKDWEGVEFPPPFGRQRLPEEEFISELDAKSGASLKLTILNKEARVWTMVAGGGASVVYTDTLCDIGGADLLANYGEYSGAPTEGQTAAYAATIIKLMCGGDPHPNGKILIIGGGIANFTNVADTFRGIIQSIDEHKEKLRQHKVTIFVRRGGPNYQEGLRQMREVGERLSIPIYVFGPEVHMTYICRLALGQEPVPEDAWLQNYPNPKFVTVHPPKNDLDADMRNAQPVTKEQLEIICSQGKKRPLPAGEILFTNETKSIVWGMQNRAIQNMLDFDFVCRREFPSVTAVVYPFVKDHKQKFYFGSKEVFIPVYSDLDTAFSKHREASVLINFASLRSAYDSTLQAMNYDNIKTVVIIAEGIPERLTRKLVKVAEEKKVNIIGPATVGGIKPGCFKIGNTAGMIDNILESKLYRPGSVAYVTKSGGMSNELNNIISKEADGVYEGVAIGGDRYPVTTFLDHLIRYEKDPNVKMMVLLGEVGGIEEYKVCQAMLKKQITKPLVAWCIGTCSAMFKSEVQFGHAGSSAASQIEEATYKNRELRRYGAFVPETFDSLGKEIGAVYQKLVVSGTIVPQEEVAPPKVPMDFDWAMKLGLVRKPAAFVSTICDERGKELQYSGVPISAIVERPNGIGVTLSLLWFQRELPEHFCKFLEMCLVITADHGPAVSGAHNTIVTARAGKDLISSVVSGLLTIGDRFGGALDKAALDFSAAHEAGQHPMEFVNEKRAKGELIMGIGHRVKSINNPDERVSCLKRFVEANFANHPTLDYALAVEAITTRKKPNLILNVDGLIAAAFVDLFSHSGLFTKQEADQYIKMGSINALFVLGRTIGLVGHFLDQKRLQQPLYRHPWQDIAYLPRV